MGKGFNNYMTKKFFHPASKDNIKRKWMAEQKTAFEKKSQEELLAQYQKEQEVLSNRALLGDEKAKLGLSFLYDAPPGLKKKEECEGQQQEVKFEWQRKYNAPRENYAKDDDTIRDQPFGIEVRNVRCIKCRQWGHVNTDMICPLFGKNLTAEPEMPETSNTSLLDGLKEDGFTIKNSVLGRIMGSQPDRQHNILQEDEDDPEVKFLKSLTPKQKKKLLKKLNKMQSTSGKGIGKKSKKKKSSGESEDSDSPGEDESRHSRSHEKKKKVDKHHKSQHKHRHSRPDSSDSESTQRVKRKDERKVCKRDRSMSSDEDSSRHASDRQRKQGFRSELDRRERNEHRSRERSRSKERRRKRSRSNDRGQRYEKYDHGKRRDKS